MYSHLEYSEPLAIELRRKMFILTSAVRRGMVGRESYSRLTAPVGTMGGTFCPELLVGAPRSPDSPSRTPSFFRGAASSCG